VRRRLQGFRLLGILCVGVETERGETDRREGGEEFLHVNLEVDGGGGG
jgi:hypothetical protein